MQLSLLGETHFPSNIWRPFAEHRAPIRCSPGYLIYLQGTEATCFYYLRKGRVKSYIQSEQGDERVLNIYEEGSLFGEASFFDELPRVSSAVAMTDCLLVPIDREQVSQEIAKDPELALAMMKYLARTVRLLSGQVDQMAFRPAKWRIAQYLLTTPAQNGEILCNQEEIAAAVSLSRVTVNRILSSLAQQNIIERKYRKIRILDKDALQDLCQNE